MIESTFRRLALAQGLLPPAPPPPWHADAAEAPPEPEWPRAEPSDNPAMADQHDPAA